MISMMMSALAPPAAATATTISVVLNVTKNKEVESGLITRETTEVEGLRTVRDPQDGLGWEKAPFLRNGPKQFFA